MRKIYYLMAMLMLLVCTELTAQQIDQAYNQKIREFTTDERFLPKSLLDVVDHPTIPSPLKHFGHIIGAEGHVHRSSEIYGYYQKLAQTSPMVHMQEMGKTEEGRPFYVVVIANEETMAKLDHYKDQLAKLSDSRKTNPEQAERIILDSKPVYYVSGGMHATEMGSPEMLMELAYRLATSSAPDIKQITDNIITVINPIMEPDGLDKQVDWYYRYTKGREFIDDGFPRSPPYWAKYVFHDNNRDGLQVSQEITKSIFKGFFEFHPTVMLDLHESVPLLYISTGTGPYNDYVDPITQSEWQVMGNHDVAAVASEGMPGAFTWAFYDGWWPGYGIWVANNHNSNGRFYETYGNSGADTYLRDLSTARYAGDLATSKEWYRPDPATPLVNWSFRNNINYTQVGVIASLSYAANNAKLLLTNYYKKGYNSVEKGKKEGPKAFTIAKNQKDPVMAAYLAGQLLVQGIEVHESEEHYVVLTEQPYRNLLVSLMTAQDYPKDAKFPPYDAIAWTLPYLYGVEVEAKDSIHFEVSSLKMLTEAPKYSGKVSGDGGTYILPYHAQNTVLPALYWLKSQNKNAEISLLSKQTIVGSDTLFPGSLVLKKINKNQASSFASEFGLDLKGTSATIQESDQQTVSLPKVAIYHTWYNTQDEGWSRYTFDQRKIPYTSIDKDVLKAGNLKSKFDVIILPRTRGNLKNFVNGVDKKFGPMPFTKTAEFQSHGMPASTNDMTGGPGYLGMDNLRKFVEEGGLLISFDNTSSIVAESGLTPELSPVSAGSLFHPGSIIRAKARKSGHPVLYGFPEEFTLFRGNGPLLQTNKYNRNLMLVQYGSKPLKDEVPYEGHIMGMPEKAKVDKEEKKEEKAKPYVVSGMVRNEQEIVGHGAVFNVPVGKGNVLAFTFDPLHRYLNHHDAPMVWNAIINWDRLR
ncbi:Zinc carboxypeptidase [Aquiflexum balticum DSM 16537]|uniref:Zinc carboxypeptidase n=1 Tax=Aquiflexum balticum DSM 16537 TaxID=758820 RepID=A0A1W2H6T7_9BACT|nr:M14 family zinc carboxypeptidase [Aquiflexum balticum]SMD44474.1 Zinc carboxypeptidase [Aquiflexum balticum DSM 16537]